MKQCPYCAEDIKDAAIFCKHCRRDIGGSQAATTRSCPFCHNIISIDAKTCSACGDDARGSRSPSPLSSVVATPKSPVKLALGLLALVALVGYAMMNNSNVRGPANAYLQIGSTEPGGVSLDQFKQLQDGMTYVEAVRTLGSSGTEQSRSSIGDIVTVMYSWPGAGTSGGNMNAMFQNDKLVSKAQFGLR